MLIKNWTEAKPLLLGYSETVEALQGELLRACGYSGVLRYLLNIPVEREGLDSVVEGIEAQLLPLDEYELDANDVYGFSVATPRVKESLFELMHSRFGVRRTSYMTLIDPSCSVSASVAIGNGSLIEQACIFASYARVGFGVTIKRGSNIAHHVVIDDYARINPGVTISGGCRIGKGVTLGVGATLIDGVEVGAGSIIGAGSLVTKSIPANVVAYGSPCRVVRNIVSE